ncbi:MAG: ATP-grasp domain-containing protein [Bacteroidota bacterium]
MRTNILITSAGRRVSLVKSFQVELKKLYPDAKVFAADLKPQYSAACQIADKFFKVGSIDSPNYINELQEICNSNNIGIVIPTIDTELKILSENRHKFIDVLVLVSDKNFINICRDKRLTHSFFIQNEISIPKQFDKYNPKFPLFIKPNNGSLSADIHLIHNKDEISTKFLLEDKYMFMEYLSPTEYSEFTIDLYYDKNSNLKCVVPRKRIEVRGGEISKGITTKNEIVSFVKNKLNRISGAIGCLTMQVFLNNINDQIIGIEINPRFGGGYPLSYFAGANYPKFIIQEYLLNEEIEYFEGWEENTLMLRYDSEIIIHE